MRVIRAIGHASCFVAARPRFSSVLLLLAVASHPAAADEWIHVADMSQPRVAFGAVLLSDGRVLAVGGISSIGANGLGIATETAELYDPTTQTWQPAASLPSPRSRLAIAALPDGRVLVAGGRAVGDAGPDMTECQLYDPDTDSWTATGELTSARDNTDLVALPDGRELIAGGVSATDDTTGNAVLKSAELFDPDTGTWTPTDKMSVARFQVRPVLLDDGRVLVAGDFGRASNHNPTNAAELFDGGRGVWKDTSPMSTARAMYAPVSLLDGRVLATGGLTRHTGFGVEVTAESEVFDPDSETWSAVGTLAEARGNYAAARLPDGSVLVAGGNDGAFVALDSAERFDPSSGQFVAAGRMPGAHVAPVGVALTDGSVLVIGGNSGRAAGSRPLRTVELYRP